MASQPQSSTPFVKLGEFLGAFCTSYKAPEQTHHEEESWFLKFSESVERAHHYNGWFTKENVLHAFEQWAIALSEDNIAQWLANYDLARTPPKQVALILAGNIPLVGFHDLLAVLITGNTAVVKRSSNDAQLIPLLVDYMCAVDTSLKNRVVFTKEKLPDFDAVIATGSSNTSRYFEYYFGHKPHIIRKNRNSVAVLTGNETNTTLSALGEDIFRYYGLGCRSVSKLWVPKGYNFDAFFNAIFPYKYLIEQHKYANNYDYNKAVYLMSEFKILDNGFLMAKNDSSYASPIATIFYEEYENVTDVKRQLSTDKDALQCIVSEGLFDCEIPFGKTQTPKLWDYADGVDTIDFLLKTT